MPINEAIEELEKKLNLMQMSPQLQAEAKRHLDNIKSQASSLINDQTFSANSTFLLTAFAGVGEGAYRAYEAFNTKPPSVFEGSAEVMRLAGSAAQLLTFAGKAGGPVGVFLGEILSLVASVLVGLGPAQKSVGDQLRKELREFSGEETVNRLAGVLDSLEFQEADFKKQKANSKTWDQILGVGSLEKGPEVIWLGDAVSWLARDANQELKAWPYVFEGYLLSAQQYLENLILAFNALKKLDDNGTRLNNEDMDRAGSVLETVCHHYETFIKDVGPVALNNGTIWHIGKSKEVYRRGMVVSDSGWDSLGGVSTRLSVGIGERVWTIGNGKHVWTGYGPSSSWKKTSINADDIWVIKRDPKFSAGKGLVSDVYTIEDGKFCWRTWDEAIKEDVKKPEPERWEKFVGEKYSVAPPAPYKVNFETVGVMGNGILYFLASAGDLGFCDVKSSHWDLFSSFPSRIPAKGIAISKENNIYAFTKDQIYFSTYEAVRARRSAWKEVDGPSSNNVMPKNWSYDQLYACDDGSLLATIQKKIYLWDGQKWRKNEPGEAVRLFKVPVRGWEIYGAVKNLVENVRKINSRGVSCA